MKNKIIKFLKYLKYGRHDKQIFKDYKDIINVENFKRLKLLVFCELVFNFIAFFVMTIYKNSSFIHTNGYFYNIIISLVYSIFIFIPGKKKLKYTTFIFYTYILISLIVYKTISIDYNASSQATTIFGMLLMYTYMFLDKPHRFSLFYLSLGVWFAIASFEIKEFSIALTDCVNGIVFIISSCAINYYQFNERLGKQITIRRIAKERDTDHLTKLKSRMITEINVADYLSEKHDTISALFVIDLDNFKFVNDTYGHEKGDEVLRKVALCLKKIFRKEDYISRIGGDEFVVFIADLNNKELACKKAKTLIQEVDKIKVNDLNIVGCSVGIAYSSENDDYHSLFSKADQAMYIAKNNGKNNYKIFEK